MKSSSSSWFAAIAAAGSVLIHVSLAPASAVPLSEKIVTIKAAAGTRTAEWDCPFPANLQIDDSYHWSLAAAPLQLESADNVVLATVNGLSVTYTADVGISLAFDLVAGDATTIIDISSATLGFSPLVNPEALAQVDVTVVDENLNSFAKLAGKMPQPWGYSGYQARYNGASAWADLVGDMNVISPGGDGRWEQGRPEAAPSLLRETIPGTVTSIETQWKFSVTSGDRAFGTSTFSVIPEPSTLALLLFGLALARRHRHTL
jgi:hypothetical protein